MDEESAELIMSELNYCGLLMTVSKLQERVKTLEQKIVELESCKEKSNTHPKSCCKYRELDKCSDYCDGWDSSRDCYEPYEVGI